MRLFLLSCFCVLPAACLSDVTAFDSAAHGTYDDGIQTGDNGGFGFNPWSTLATGTAQVFVGSSNVNGAGEGPGIDTAGRSWGATSPSATSYLSIGQTSLTRSFADSYEMKSGDRLSIDFDFGPVASGPSSFISHPVVRLGLLGSHLPSVDPSEIYITPGDTLYQLSDYAGGTHFDLPVSSGGFRAEWHILSEHSYEISLTSYATGQSQTLSRPSFSDRTNFSGLYFQTYFSGADPTNHMFVNSMRLSTVPEPVSLIAVAGGVVALLRRQKRR